jgi:hypothetical protein
MVNVFDYQTRLPLYRSRAFLSFSFLWKPKKPKSDSITIPLWYTDGTLSFKDPART